MSHCVSLLLSGEIENYAVFEEVLKPVDHIVSRCVAIAVHDVFNVNALKNMMQKAVGSLVSWHVKEMFYCILSSICVSFLLSFLVLLVWRMFFVVF